MVAVDIANSAVVFTLVCTNSSVEMAVTQRVDAWVEMTLLGTLAMSAFYFRYTGLIGVGARPDFAVGPCLMRLDHGCVYSSVRNYRHIFP